MQVTSKDKLNRICPEISWSLALMTEFCFCRRKWELMRVSLREITWLASAGWCTTAPPVAVSEAWLTFLKQWLAMLRTFFPVELVPFSKSSKYHILNVDSEVFMVFVDVCVKNDEWKSQFVLRNCEQAKLNVKCATYMPLVGQEFCPKCAN